MIRRTTVDEEGLTLLAEQRRRAELAILRVRRSPVEGPDLAGQRLAAGERFREIEREIELQERALRQQLRLRQLPSLDRGDAARRLEFENRLIDQQAEVVERLGAARARSLLVNSALADARQREAAAEDGELDVAIRRVQTLEDEQREVQNLITELMRLAESLDPASEAAGRLRIRLAALAQAQNDAQQETFGLVDVLDTFAGSVNNNLTDAFGPLADGRQGCVQGSW